ncbi:hypothetical protein [Bacillus mycoides]|uniref:hypothetical protein n=1 Tax=Bacillus mycoides TaxID=1405 RepID=UPI001E48BBCE|nr:hypothetical protein [Bacillus mycoides]
MKRHQKQETQYLRVYMLRDISTKSIKVESWRTFKDEMRVLGINETDIFQIQLVEKQ